jgi:hypothetical protein
MTDYVTIKSAQDGALLELLAPTRTGTFSAHLRGAGFEGRVEVYEHEPPVHLAAFFRDLATHWRGWSGEKQWDSLEGQLSLKATSDSMGHTHLLVRLRSGPLYDWDIRGTLLLEAGQLETVADAVERFIRLSHAA